MARVHLRMEDGGEETYQLSLSELPEEGSAELDGNRLVRKRVLLPASLPLGYHDVSVAVGGRTGSMRLIVAPERAYLPPGLRAAGVAVALYGIRSRRNW